MTEIRKFSLNAGVWDKTLWWANHLDQYQSACRVLKNMIVHPHGAVERRRGFVKWKTLKTSQQ